MSEALFDKIHYDYHFHKRNEPASIEEFIGFGLQPEDYVRYIGLQQKLQSELLLHGHLESCTTVTQNGDARTICPALEELISFCLDKHLVACEDDFEPLSFYAFKAAELL